MNTIMERALRRYANTAPLDLKSAREIQKDLLHIAGDRHLHDGRSPTDIDECFICGHDIREDVHSTAKVKHGRS